MYRYYRFYMVNSFNNSYLYLMISEMEFLDSNGVDLTDNLPSSSFTSSSIYDSRFTADKVFNNKWDEKNTGWASAKGSNTNQWIVIDFQKQVKIDKIRYQTDSVVSDYSIGVKDYRVEGSNNNLDWDLLGSGTLSQVGTIQSFVVALPPTPNSLAIKSPTTDEYYSLSDNTLIHLPDNSTKNMILHGIEQGKKIQLDVPFDKHRYFNDTPVANVSGKVFTHDIGKINTLNIKELRENKDFEPLYIWHNTNMTSNNTPTRLVARASSEYNSTYTAWKAFNGTVTDSNDRWRSSDYTVNQWIKLDYGIIKRVNVVKIQGVTDSTILAGNPIEYIIEGSNDDSNWNIISNISTTAFADKETKSFFFNEVSYRYYKLTPTRNQGNVSYFNIGDIVFGYKREVK